MKPYPLPINENTSSLIKLSNNENLLGPSPKAIAAAAASLESAHIYPDLLYDGLKKDLSNTLSIHPEQLTLGNGSDNILELIIKTYLNKDNHAIISEYAFLAVPTLLKSYAIPTEVIAASAFSHDIFKMIDAVNENTRMIFIVNPNNPTGTYTQTQDFIALMEAVPRDVLVVMDEAYAEYVEEKDYPDTLKYLSSYPNLLLTRTFSKAYGLAGLRLGYAISSAEIAGKLARTNLPYPVNSVAINAARAAIKDSLHMEKTLEMTRIGRQQLAKGLEALNFSYLPSVANFITVDVLNGALIYERLLEKGIMVNPLQGYGMPKHIRVSVGTASQNAHFLSALTRIKDLREISEYVGIRG